MSGVVIVKCVVPLMKAYEIIMLAGIAGVKIEKKGSAREKIMSFWLIVFAKKNIWFLEKSTLRTYLDACFAVFRIAIVNLKGLNNFSIHINKLISKC